MVQATADCWFFLKVGQLLDSRVIKDATHELQLVAEPLINNFVDGALCSEHRDPSLRLRS